MKERKNSSSSSFRVLEKAGFPRHVYLVCPAPFPQTRTIGALVKGVDVHLCGGICSYQSVTL